MLEKLQLLYPAVDADILNMVIDNAESFVLDYCNIDEIPSVLSAYGL